MTDTIDCPCKPVEHDGPFQYDLCEAIHILHPKADEIITNKTLEEALGLDAQEFELLHSMAHSIGRTMNIPSPWQLQELRLLALHDLAVYLTENLSPALIRGIVCHGRTTRQSSVTGKMIDEPNWMFSVYLETTESNPLSVWVYEISGEVNIWYPDEYE